MTFPIIQLVEVTKKFGSFVANRAINLDVEEGEIHAIVGENGAGKSTLMRMLSGIHSPSSGKILLRNNEIKLPSPEAAMRQGIAMVHQHFSLIPSLTVAENVVLSDPPRKCGIYSRRAAERKVGELAERYGLPIRPAQRVADCRVGIQQRVEILKALYRNPDILILDEPTAVLTPQETDLLIENLKTLRAQGKTIIFITHKLKEVMALADQVTVMRAGQAREKVATAKTNVAQLATWMVGRELRVDVERTAIRRGDELLRLDNVWSGAEDGSGWRLRDVSLALNRGEILGIAGVEGNGQSELIEIVTGLRSPELGSVSVKASKLPAALSTRAMREMGISHIPEDRIAMGLALKATLRDNLIIGAHKKPPIGRGPWIDLKAAEQHAKRLVEQYDIRPGNVGTEAGTLSGGNMQKAIIARELDSAPDVIVAAHPTRGVDVGAAEFVYAQLVARRQTCGILLISSDLDEILRLSDRIIVMFQGCVMAEARPAHLTAEKLGLLMAGISSARPDTVVSAQITRGSE